MEGTTICISQTSNKREIAQEPLKRAERGTVNLCGTAPHASVTAALQASAVTFRSEIAVRREAAKREDRAKNVSRKERRHAQVERGSIAEMCLQWGQYRRPKSAETAAVADPVCWISIPGAGAMTAELRARRDTSMALTSFCRCSIGNYCHA